MAEKLVSPDKVRVAWVELDRKTGDTTLFVEGVIDPVKFAKLLASLALQYAVDRTVEATRIERATLDQLQGIAIPKKER